MMKKSALLLLVLPSAWVFAQVPPTATVTIDATVSAPSCNLDTSQTAEIQVGSILANELLIQASNAVTAVTFAEIEGGSANRTIKHKPFNIICGGRPTGGLTINIKPAQNAGVSTFGENLKASTFPAGAIQNNASFAVFAAGGQRSMNENARVPMSLAGLNIAYLPGHFTQVAGSNDYQVVLKMGATLVASWSSHLSDAQYRVGLGVYRSAVVLTMTSS
jgi:type 1 fimbria pilin